MVRAYSHAAKLAIDAAGIAVFEEYTSFRLNCGYSEYQRYLAELPKFGAKIDDTQFSDRVELCFSVKSPLRDSVCERIREMSGGNDFPEVTGVRFDSDQR